MSSSRPSSIRNPKSPELPQTAHSPRSPPLHHFDDPPDEQADDPPYEAEAEAEGDEDIPYPEPSSEQTLLPPSNFSPFFTLIEDTISGEHYHPYVHYVFADDDPVLVTAAAMRSLGLDETRYLPQVTPPEGEEPTPQTENLEGEEGSESGTQEGHAESPLPPPIPGVAERYVIVDVAADGHTIVDAQSLSPDWQITSTNIRTAPTFDEKSAEGGYMLSIEGVEVPGKSKGKGKAIADGGPGELKLKEARERTNDDLFQALDGLVKGVEGGLEVAGKIGGGRDTDVRESERTVLQDVESVAAATAVE